MKSFPSWGSRVPQLPAGCHLRETLGWRVLGIEGAGDRRWMGGDRTDGGGSADCWRVCGPQQPLPCSGPARLSPLSSGLSFLTCKQDSKSLKAAARPLSSWTAGLRMPAEAGQPPFTGLVGQGRRNTFPQVPACGAHVLVVSGQVGPSGSRMAGTAHHGGPCSTGLPSQQR